MRRLARNHEVLITVEEGAIGGFGSHVLQFLATEGLLDRGLKVRPMVLPDLFIDHDKPEKMYDAGRPQRAADRRHRARHAGPRAGHRRLGGARLSKASRERSVAALP